MVLPTIPFESLRCTLKRFSVRPYSLTSSFSDFPPFFPLLSLSLGVRNIFVRGMSTSMPTARVTRPTGRNVKNSISGTSEPTAPDAFAFVSVSCIIMFGGVPMRVIIPPMLLAKARGMRSLLEEVPAYAAMLTTIGSIRATVPVLLTKAPMNAVTSITRRNSLVSLVPASFIT